MAKIHIAANTGLNMAIFSRCASVLNQNGTVRFNGRRSYRYMSSTIVSGVEAFKAVPEADRCAHCMDVGLRHRNIRRKAKGLTPVTSFLD